MKAKRQRRYLKAYLLFSLLVGSWPQMAPAQPVCTIAELTNSTGGFVNFTSSATSINAKGTLIAFESDRDLTGSNADRNREIFLFNTNTATLSQVTNTTNTNTVGQVISHSAPSMNADGTRMVFSSNADLTGDNTDGNTEIFLAETNTTATTFTQITQTVGEFISNGVPSISGDGTRMVFTSNADLTGDNADGNTETFLAETNTTATTFTQITHTVGEHSHEALSINADGTGIVFTSNADLTGDNADGNTEIFLASCTAPPEADLSIAIDPVPMGNNLTYTVRVTNNGPDDATGVALFDKAPVLTRLVSVSSTQGTCTEMSDLPIGAVVRCNLGDLAKATTATVTIVVTPLRAGTITNTASVRGHEADPDTTNNSATAVTTVVN